jgi:hypothetical protein
MRPTTGTNCLRSLERWERGFDSHLRHGVCIVCLLCVRVVLSVGRGLATGWSPVQGILPCIGSRNWKSGRGPTKGCRAIIIIIIIIMIMTREKWPRPIRGIIAAIAYSRCYGKSYLSHDGNKRNGNHYMHHPVGLYPKHIYTFTIWVMMK